MSRTCTPRERAAARAVGLALGYATDRLLADPRRGHPVALFGSVVSRAEDRWWADSVGRGAWVTGTATGLVAIGALAVERLVSRSVVLQATAVAAATWVALGGTSLEREGVAMSRLLTAGDVSAARVRLSHLCARDAGDLGADELTRAAVESLAENTSDAVVASLLWGGIAGVPGLLVHRAVNTLDAMVGYRSERYERYGRVAARFDDVLGFLPARLTAGLTVLLARTVGGRPTDAWSAWRRDAPRHPSPNAGPVEAAFAGALGVRLGGTSSYGGALEDRGTLGEGRAVQVGDLARTVRLSRLVGLASLAVSVGVSMRLATGLSTALSSRLAKPTNGCRSRSVEEGGA